MNRGRPPPAPPPKEEHAFDEGVRVIEKIGRGFIDWMTSESDEKFCEELDAKHGMNTAELLAKVKRKKEDVALPVKEKAAPALPQHATGRAPPLEEEEEDVILVVEEDAAPPCSFCKGKTVVSLNPRTKKKTRVACPSCGKEP